MTQVPIFPLPETVLFPKVALPLHLFEPRYRQMGDDLARGDGLLVVVLLKPGWEQDYQAAPPVHETATLGRVERHEKLEDGRYNILLRGLERVRLQEADEVEPATERLYRVRQVETAPEQPVESSEAVSELNARLAARWKELLNKSGQSESPEDALSDSDFEALINNVASHLDIPPQVRQTLLEEDQLLGRALRVEHHLDERLKFWRTLSRFRDFKPDDPSVN